MIRNLYLILVVALRTVGLFFVGTAAVGFLVASLLQRNTGAALVGLIGLSPALIGGLVLWFGAKWIAALVTRDLE